MRIKFGFIIVILGAIGQISMRCGTPIPRDQWIKYKKAVRYIRSNEPYKSKGVYVVDTLVFISETDFFHAYYNDTMNRNQVHTLIDSLDKIDSIYYHPLQPAAFLMKLNKQNHNGNPKYNIYFDYAYENVLKATVINNREDVKNPYRNIRIFNNVENFKFVFDKNNHLVKVYHYRMAQ